MSCYRRRAFYFLPTALTYVRSPNTDSVAFGRRCVVDVSSLHDGLFFMTLETKAKGDKVIYLHLHKRNWRITRTITVKEKRFFSDRNQDVQAFAA